MAATVAGGAVFLAVGANRPPDPYLAPGRSPVGGFGEIAFRIDDLPERCALLADTAEQRARGMMGRRNLAGHDAMVFRHPADTTATYYMKDTPIPLSIAWFDSAGEFVASADMLPCLDRPRCPLYGAPRPYRYALEVPRGGLSTLGIGPGAHLVLGAGCA